MPKANPSCRSRTPEPSPTVNEVQHDAPNDRPSPGFPCSDHTGPGPGSTLLTVIDNLTDEVRTYVNPQGRPFQPIQDTSALSGCSASASLSSLPTAAVQASELLLNNGRFRVEITWETADGNSDPGIPVQLTSDTGYFWFFDDSNVEVVVKVLDGCAVNGRYWVFAGGLTDVETHIRVTDTLTGAERTYTNPQGKPFLPLQDTEAFSRCP